MSTASAARPNLELVDEQTQRPHLTAVTTTEDDWSDPSSVEQWTAENQFVGALMWLPASRVRQLLDLVPATAVFHPQARWAYELIRASVDDNRDPRPEAIFKAGRTQASSEALKPGQPPSPTAQRSLALYLFEAYRAAIAPTVTVDTYAAEVLEDAYRRAFALCGIRMQQLAESGAARTDLTEQFIAIRDELADLRRRADKAAKPEKSPS